MKLRFAAMIFGFALVLAGCGKDDSNKSTAKDDEIVSLAKPLVPGAGYHADTSDPAETTDGTKTVATEPTDTDTDSNTTESTSKPPTKVSTEAKKPNKEPKEPKNKPPKSGGGKQTVKLESGGGDLKLNEIAIAPDVQDRVPQDVRRRYTSAPEVFWCWTNFSNTGEETKVTHVWRHKNKVRSKVEVTVGNGKRWRSWSRHSPGGKSGEWSCEILDPQGKRLGSASVTIGG